jgi:hypothetical protein
MITVWHPLGDETTVTILKPWSWTDEEAITVTAVLTDGDQSVDFTINQRKVTFQLDHMLSGKKLIRYEVSYGGELSGIEEKNMIAGEVDVKIFPNPFGNQTNIYYNVTVPQKLSIRMYDQSGVETECLLDRWLESGNHSLILDTRDYPPGIYYLVLESNKNQHAQKLVIVK